MHSYSSIAKSIKRVADGSHCDQGDCFHLNESREHKVILEHGELHGLLRGVIKPVCHAALR